MSGPAIPASIVGDVLREVARHAPDAVALARDLFAAQGFDLGPMTPDLARHMYGKDEEINEEIQRRRMLAAAEHAAVSDTDRPPPRESER